MLLFRHSVIFFEQDHRAITQRLSMSVAGIIVPLVFRGDAPEEHPGSVGVHVLIDPSSPCPERSVECFLCFHLNTLPVPLEVVPPEVTSSEVMAVSCIIMVVYPWHKMSSRAQQEL